MISRIWKYQFAEPCCSFCWFQVLSLDGTQMEWVADHLGHSFDVERTYYRVASSTIERAKIAKLLILADSGNIDGCKGKTLDELSFEGKWRRLISLNIAQCSLK